MNTPKISIGITCYNADDTIEDAVKSARLQSWPNKEIIIVDDCSDQKTLTKLAKISSKYPDIHIIYHSKNRGVAAARNKIIENAKGDFIAFFDDDDESSPNRVETQFDRITSYENEHKDASYIICHSARIQRFPNNTERYEATMGTNSGLCPYGDKVALRILTGKPSPQIFGSIATCSQMSRTSTYKSLGGFDETFRRSEDTEFNVRAALHGAHFIGIQEPLVYQTMTLSSEKTIDEEQKYALKLITKYKDYIDNNLSFLFCKEWINTKNTFIKKKTGLFIFKLGILFIKHPIYTTKKIIWAFPNIKFNIQLKNFHYEAR